MHLAVVRAGRVGTALADSLRAAGHDVAVPLRGHEEAAVRAAEAVVLAVPFAAVAEVVPRLADHLAGKVVIDCTNPVGPGLTHGLQSSGSGSAVVQGLAPRAAVVKAFSIYGWENLTGPAMRSISGTPRPLMMIAGDDASATETVVGLASDLGWDPLVVGGLDQALHLEHLTLLWIRLVRGQGRDPHLVWTRIERSDNP